MGYMTPPDFALTSETVIPHTVESDERPQDSLTILVPLTAEESQLFFPEGIQIEGWNVVSHRFSYCKETRQRCWEDLLREMNPTVLVTCWSAPRLPEKWLLSDCCNLKYVCHVVGSVRHLLPREFIRSGRKVTNWGKIVAPQVAEHALLLLLACLRMEKNWSKRNYGECRAATRTLFGKSIGIHGFGATAVELLSLLRPFQPRLHAFSRGVPPTLMRRAGVESCASLEELFQRCEIIIECEALTENSTRTVTAEVLALLRDDAVFINVGRGKVVDETALIREAVSGRLRMGLDVLATEPVPRDSPLPYLDNVILSPHIAGPTGDRLQSLGQMALANLQRFTLGLPLEGEVTLEVFDRST